MMRKRIAAWALTACMALTLLPLHAGAVPISGPSATEAVLPTQVTAAAEENTVHALQAAGLPVYTLQKMGTTGKIWCCCCWATATRKISSSNFFRRRGYRLAA